MKHSKRIIIPAFFIISVFLLQGCFKEIADIREPLPDIIWPAPPDVPRIRFVNAITGPADLNIKEQTINKFLNFLKGKKLRPIVSPYGITVDKAGRLYVVDTFNKSVYFFDRTNNTYHTFPDKKTPLKSPIDIATDSNGYIYISDSHEAVIKVFRNEGKEYVREIGRGLLERPTGLAVNNRTGELLVVDTLRSQILKYNIEDLKFKGDIGSAGNIDGLFHYPTNIFVTDDGRIYVSDSLNFRIQIFTPEGQFVKTFGEAGDGPGYFSRPKGVAVDSDGNIYVVDALFDNVQIFDPGGRLLMDFGGTGREYGKFWLPTGIFIDERDRIYVSDSYNKRVQVFQYMKSENYINVE